MEALLIAALLYLATQVTTEVTEKITDQASSAIAERFGKLAGKTSGDLLDLVRRRMRGDDEARRVLENFESSPRDVSQIKAISRQIRRLRQQDKDFDARLTELTVKCREESDALWNALTQMKEQIETGQLPSLANIGIASPPPETETPPRVPLPDATVSPLAEVPAVPALPDLPGSTGVFGTGSDIGAVKAGLRAIAQRLPPSYFVALVGALTEGRDEIHKSLAGTHPDGPGAQALRAIDAAAHHATELHDSIYVLCSSIDDYNASH